ncbi:hypothetical protein [Methylobacterium haplocladii]|uniref:Uncharacterized protein n=1 Tax=Methylobacterium haplocladii TaxID=1176176 RepID=A0A512IS26_9HYPH|nr:hypothetical protein [Methylobacterium haplocladii]GEP00510.1 hypothetical protein MHA02_28970 [Methylobacterium haplocladii]GJD85425.1 hypothetical protein HPGCJGGD_3314 [Methylobacterium haplocladii]GLS57810.1 hypothetical protein GCM10007887_04660 [Methylobacterium haplocladii]
MTKTCSSKFNAQRAAKRLGLDIATLDFARVADGSWGWSEKAQLALIDAPTVEEISVVQIEPAAIATNVTVLTTPLGRAPKGKTRLVLEAATALDGVTTTELKALTGWTKFGGFYNAVEAAGLKLHRCREGHDTRWFAVPADEREVRAYVEIDGRWTLFGIFDTAAGALDAANEAAEPEGETCTATTGKRGEVLLRAAETNTQGMAKAA